MKLYLTVSVFILVQSLSFGANVPQVPPERVFHMYFDGSNELSAACFFVPKSPGGMSYINAEYGIEVGKVIADGVEVVRQEGMGGGSGFDNRKVSLGSPLFLNAFIGVLNFGYADPHNDRFENYRYPVGLDSNTVEIYYRPTYCFEIGWHDSDWYKLVSHNRESGLREDQ